MADTVKQHKEVVYISNASEDAVDLKDAMIENGFSVKEVFTGSAKPSAEYGGIMIFGYRAIYQAFGRNE